jgi:hypothetical protein
LSETRELICFPNRSNYALPADSPTETSRQDSVDSLQVPSSAFWQDCVVQAMLSGDQKVMNNNISRDPLMTDEEIDEFWQFSERQLPKEELAPSGWALALLWVLVILGYFSVFIGIVWGMSYLVVWVVKQVLSLI